MQFSLDEVDASWRTLFSYHSKTIDQIFETIGGEIAPPRSDVFRAFRRPMEEVKILILGQDPYPGVGVADGLAFSSYSGNSIPASLRNIFKEYSSDLGLPTPVSPDLTAWSERGVLLLNRTLTTTVGERNVHAKQGWSSLTEAVAKSVAERNVIAILWGNSARSFAPLFTQVIESVHPSPLSARNGFFGSRPFTRANALLSQQGKDPVDWSL
ncbi:Ung Uracil DNA glycosylase [Candidatus Nanopelagicaceae bacterium]